MAVFAADKQILRTLAYDYLYACRDEQIVNNQTLHKAVNDLHMIRPVVLIDELPWHEMQLDDELILRCKDPYLRNVEWYFRTVLYQYHHFRADMTILPFLPVPKVTHTTGIGLTVVEDRIAQSDAGGISSHAYVDQLATEEAVDALQMPVITYDEAETMRRYQLIGELVGDILPVRLSGIGYFYAGIWDDISRYRGVTNLLMDLAANPDLMHRTAQKMFAVYHSMADQYEALGLFDVCGNTLHCTPIMTEDLPKVEDGKFPACKNVWGRGMAQIFASVSKEMRKEFDIQYMKRLLGRFGLSYYGCCEPLDTMIDILEQIPNLRKIGVTPWADVHVAAEAIGKKYVASVKPNPAAVAVPHLDTDMLRKEIGNILEAIKRYGCAADIVLKDISTCGGNPANIFEWEKIVMEMVQAF